MTAALPRVITPGTLIDENFIDPYANNYVMAIYIHRPDDGGEPAASLPRLRSTTLHRLLRPPPALGSAPLGLAGWISRPAISIRRPRLWRRWAPCCLAWLRARSCSTRTSRPRPATTSSPFLPKTGISSRTRSRTATLPIRMGAAVRVGNSRRLGSRVFK